MLAEPPAMLTGVVVFGQLVGTDSTSLPKLESSPKVIPASTILLEAGARVYLTRAAPSM